MGKNDDLELLTDLKLALGNSNQCIHRRSSNESGAGVNAASRVDMTFVPSDPLSELVWSPHKGLSLKCTDCGFSESKPRSLWDVGSSNMILSLSEGILPSGTANENPINQENLTASQSAFHMEGEAGEKTYLARSPRTSASLTSVREPSCGPQRGQENQREIDLMLVRTNEPVAKSDPLSGKDKEVTMPHLMFPAKGEKGPELVMEAKRTDELKISHSNYAPPLENQEFTAENELQLLTDKDGSRQNEYGLPTEESPLPESSPTDSRARFHGKKGKEKASSGGDFKERMSKDEDDSHESVESCNSAGLLSRGTKRWNFEQQIIVESKRVRRHNLDSPASTSFSRQDSSFMNWISNMIKGLFKSNQAGAPSLALTLVNPDNGLENHDQQIISSSNAPDPGIRTTGFQTMLRSIYCSNPKEKEPSISNDEEEVDGSKELVRVDNISGGGITPIVSDGENDNFHKPFSMLKEKSKESTTETGGGQSFNPENVNVNIFATPCDSMAYSKVKDGRSTSSCSLGKRKSESGENNNSSALEGQMISGTGHRSNPLGSLWITRLSPKAAAVVSNFDHHNQRPNEALECSPHCPGPIHHNRVYFPFDQKSTEVKEQSVDNQVNVVGKELHTYGLDVDSAFGLKKINSDDKSIYHFNHALSSPKLKSSEDMASVFARRLDALKHIKPSEVKDGRDCTVTTCFYCGVKGHDLRNCSEIEAAELDNFLQDTISCNVAEGFSRQCIRCNMLDHWAVSCPARSLDKRHQADQGASLVCHFGSGKRELALGNEGHSGMLEAIVSCTEEVSMDAVCSGKQPIVDSSLCLNSRLDGIVSSSKRVSCSDEPQKHTASSSRDDALNPIRITPLCDLADMKLADVPKRMFGFIKKLQLSRMDIFKWINSRNPLSKLNGFFLRLRLAKLEQKLGGTGYHVACITGEQRERVQEGSKVSVRVVVGGAKCWVESQYISNNDFLEDELMAWWLSTVKSGENILAEDHLKSKLEERGRLGF